MKLVSVLPILLLALFSCSTTPEPQASASRPVDLSDITPEMRAMLGLGGSRGEPLHFSGELVTRPVGKKARTYLYLRQHVPNADQTGIFVQSLTADRKGEGENKAWDGHSSWQAFKDSHTYMIEKTDLSDRGYAEVQMNPNRTWKGWTYAVTQVDQGTSSGEATITGDQLVIRGITRDRAGKKTADVTATLKKVTREEFERQWNEIAKTRDSDGINYLDSKITQ